LCEACIFGKQTRLPLAEAKDKNHVTRPLFIIHTDVCGPITPMTIDEKNYFVTFIDESTHYTVVYLISHKSQVFQMFKDFVSKSETHFNLKIAYLYCDNGGEYLSNDHKAFCVQKGIQYHLTVPRKPEQNGVSKRMNRTLLEKARCIIHGAGLPKELWGEAILTATYLLNINPTRALNDRSTPFELWHKKKPKLKYLKVFGCTAYVLNKSWKGKIDARSIPGILVGYEPNDYKIFFPDPGETMVVCDIIFDDIDFIKSRPSAHSKEKCESSNRFETDDNLKISKINETDEISENSKSHTNEFNKPDSEAEKIDERTIIENESKNDSNNHNLRQSGILKNLPSVCYDEGYCYHSFAQSVICEAPKSYSEIKDRDDRL